MAARPNTTRTLQYGLSLADVQCDRLTRAIAMANFALANNKLLTNEEIAAYKTAINLARKQQAIFEKVSTLTVPADLIPPTKRRPGRPSAKELEAIKTAKSGKTSKADKSVKTAKATKTAVTAKSVKTAGTTGKRRGRPAKTAAVSADVTPTVKRRGRPPKASKTAAATNVSDVTSVTSDTKS